MKNGVSHLYTTIWSPPPHFGGLVTHCFFVNWRLMTHWTKREEKTFSFFAYCLKTYNFRVISPVLLVFNSKLSKIKTKMESVIWEVRYGSNSKVNPCWRTRKNWHIGPREEKTCSAFAYCLRSCNFSITR